MRRAFTLVETLVAFAISLLIVIASVQFGLVAGHHYLKMRRDVAAITQLSLARDQIGAALLQAEPEFFACFERVATGPCQGQGRRATSVAPACAIEGNATQCLEVWDIDPSHRSQLTYKVTEWNLPDWIAITPVDEVQPQGPGEEIGAMSVLMIGDGPQAQPFLVASVSGMRINLARSAAPWPVPQTQGPVTTRLTHLGQLSVIHFAIHRDARRRGTLSQRTLTWRVGEWVASRSRTSHMYLKELKYDRQRHGINLVSQGNQGVEHVAWIDL